MDDVLIDRLAAAFEAGFNSSAEGFNGEFPLDDDAAATVKDRALKYASEIVYTIR